VVLSYDYWRTHFGASRDVIGQTLRINGHPFTIVGIAPENFHTAIGGYRPSIFVPVTMSEIAMPWSVSRHNLDNHQSLWMTVVARLKPGGHDPSGAGQPGAAVALAAGPGADAVQASLTPLQSGIPR